jgi:hypothetical protein
MKVQTYIAWSVVAGVLLLTTAWWYGLGQKKPASLPETTPSVLSRFRNLPASNNPTAFPNVPSANPPTGTTSQSSSTIDRKATIIESIMAARNTKSLDFYGKIIDQNNQAVPGVKVTARVGLYLGITHDGEKDYNTESDASGDFSFTGIRGAGTGFTLRKEGYIYDQRQASSSRADDYTPDPNNPVIFAMWKLTGAEPMIHARVHAYIPCDGTTATFSLLTGRGTGDLTVTLTRNPVNIDRSKPFDWTLAVGIANGGLVETTDVYPDKAPIEGYRTSVSIGMSADDKNWSSSSNSSYYFKSGNTYGRMMINVKTNFQPPPTLFDADIYSNPSGSQNLEYDPSKEINQ